MFLEAVKPQQGAELSLELPHCASTQLLTSHRYWYWLLLERFLLRPALHLHKPPGPQARAPVSLSLLPCDGSFWLRSTEGELQRKYFPFRKLTSITWKLYSSLSSFPFALICLHNTPVRNPFFFFFLYKNYEVIATSRAVMVCWYFGWLNEFLLNTPPGATSNPKSNAGCWLLRMFLLNNASWSRCGNQPHFPVVRAAFVPLQDTRAALSNIVHDSKQKSNNISLLGVQSNENVQQNLLDIFKKWLRCSFPDATTCSEKL